MLADNISQTQDYYEYTVMISKIKNLCFTKTMWDYVIWIIETYFFDNVKILSNFYTYENHLSHLFLKLSVTWLLDFKFYTKL